MRLSPLATRTRLIGLATCAAGAVLLAQVGAAAAVPASGSSTTAAPSSSSSSGTSSSTAGGSVSTSAAGSPSTSAPAAKPKAVAPPADAGPACTAHQGTPNPVICLPADSGEDEPAALSRGDDTEFDTQIVNQGSTPVAHATVVITLPQGLTLEPDEGLDGAVYRIDDWYSQDNKPDFTDLPCTGGPLTIMCDVGGLAAGENILVAIDLEVSEDATPGSTLDFRVDLEPVGAPTYDPTFVTASIEVLKPAHLVVSLAPADLHVVVGRRATITGTVRNAGSDPAPSAVAVAIDANQKHPKQTHFVITNGKQFPIDDFSDGPTDGSESSAAAGPVTVGPGGAITAAVLSTRGGSTVRSLLQRHALGRSATSVQRHSLPSVAFWPIGTLAPGAVAHVDIKLRALTLGTDTLTFGAISGEAEQECDGFGGESGSGSSSESAVPTLATIARAAAAAPTTTAPTDCSFIVQTKITAVKAAAAPLANSGTHGLDVQVGIAVWALVLGALLVWVGRRRTAPARQH